MAEFIKILIIVGIPVIGFLIFAFLFNAIEGANSKKIPKNSDVLQEETVQGIQKLDGTQAQTDTSSGTDLFSRYDALVKSREAKGDNVQAPNSPSISHPELSSEIANNHAQKYYHYKRREYFMTRAEHEFFDVLIEIAGEVYFVFPQVHLPSILNNRVVGQSWDAAFLHINQKSVDFVLCDKEFLAPMLAIELDDYTHQRPDRMLRDQEVERMFKEAGLPLLRIENHGYFDASEIAEKINDALGVYSTVKETATALQQ